MIAFNPNTVEVTMKKLMTSLAALALALTALAQVPQFSSRNFTGWEYTNSSLALNESNILGNKIVLYVNSLGQPLTLVSPQFNCQAGETIDMKVTWVTDMWLDDGFVMSKVALTAALLDKNGHAVDSVTWNPADLHRFNEVNLSIMVPRGLSSARLRFASWKADVYSSGAVRQIAMTSQLKGDVNDDGEVTVADVNAVISVITGDQVDEGVVARADVNGDHEVTIADINEVLGFILK